MAEQSVVDLFKKIAGNEYGFFSRLGSITDVINSDIPTSSCDDTFGKLVGRNNVRTIESRRIVDPDDGGLIGTLKRSTILRYFPRHLNSLVEKEEDSRVITTPLSSLVSRPADLLPTTATPMQALDLFLEEDCDFVAVGDDPKEIRGIVTPLDFVRTMQLYYQIYNQVKPLQRLRLIDLDQIQLDEIFFRGAQTARDLMQPVRSIDVSEPVLAAIKTMHDDDVHQIVLTENDEDTNDVLSIEDIFIGLKVPENPRILTELSQEPQYSSNVATGRLGLIPWDAMCESKDPFLREACQAAASTKTAIVEPTARLQEVLSHFLYNDELPVILVRSDKRLEGIVTVREILRIFKTLLRIQDWESDPPENI